MIQTIHKAKYIVPDPYTILENACIGITEDGRISDIAPLNRIDRDASSQVVEWGDALILPGLVNAHTHLELTALCARLTQFKSFTDWLAQLISRRRSWKPDQVRASIREGLALSLAAGTTTVGDISSTKSLPFGTDETPVRQVLFEERIALSPEQAEENISDLERFFDSSGPTNLRTRGISPHAPYSVSGKLYRGLASLARARNMPLATHIAETEEEVRFLQSGTGEFRDFLQGMNALPRKWSPPGLSPIPYLHSLNVLGPNCILIHCNYIDLPSIRMIADSGSSIVYCPRSHAFFDHEKHPIRRLIDAGINVALGTDSLASNSSLSILDEMRFLHGSRKDLKAEEIIQAATSNGAKALNLGPDLGKLQSGHRADMTVLEAAANLKTERFAERILERAGTCIGTIVAGKSVWRSTNL